MTERSNEELEEKLGQQEEQLGKQGREMEALREALERLQSQVAPAAPSGDSHHSANEEGDSLRAGNQAADGGGAAASGGSGGVGPGERNSRRESFGVRPTAFPASSWSRVGPAEPVPKFPPSGTKQNKMSWYKRIENYLDREGLSHVLTKVAQHIPINAGGDRPSLDLRYSRPLVDDHLRAFGILQSAVVNAPFEPRVLASKSFPEAWQMVGDHILPRSEDETHLLRTKLETIPHYKGEDPQDFLARADNLLNTLSAAGEQVPENDVVRIIVRQLSSDYDVEKRSTLTQPGLSRYEVEKIIRNSYARRKAGELRKTATSAPPASAPSPASVAQNNPHALALGTADGFRQGGRGGYGHQPGGGGGGMGAGRMARGPPPSQQQQQWSRGGWSSQQQRYGPPQQQQGSYGGGAPHQTSWDRGGSYRQQPPPRGWWPSPPPPPRTPPWQQGRDSTGQPWDFEAAYNQFYADWVAGELQRHGPRPQAPPPRQQSRQQPPQRTQRSSMPQPPAPHGPPTPSPRSSPPPLPHSRVLPPRDASGKLNRGVGGVYDSGRNADYFQTKTPPPPGKPQGWVHQCERCGCLEHTARDCDAVRRMEGYCSTCGDWGHPAARCRLRPSRRTSGGYRYPQANVVTATADGYEVSSAPASYYGGVVDADGYYTPDPVGNAAAGYTDAAGYAGNYGGEEPIEGSGEPEEEPPVSAAPMDAMDDRRVTFEDVPADDDGASVYGYDEDGGGWNDDVAFQRQQHENFEERVAASLSLPCGGAGGDDGRVFDSGFMALQFKSVGSDGGMERDGSAEHDGSVDQHGSVEGKEHPRDGFLALRQLSPRSSSCASSSLRSSLSETQQAPSGRLDEEAMGETPGISEHGGAAGGAPPPVGVTRATLPPERVDVGGSGRRVPPMPPERVAGGGSNRRVSPMPPERVGTETHGRVSGGRGYHATIDADATGASAGAGAGRRDKDRPPNAGELAQFFVLCWFIIMGG